MSYQDMHEMLRSRSDNLSVLIGRIHTDSCCHLKRVIQQLPEYDIHDEDHCEAVLSKMEALLGDSIENLANYELFHLVASAYLHDIGLALTDYAYNVLVSTEGHADLRCTDSALALNHDGKKPLQLSDAIEHLGNNRSKLYNSYSDIAECAYLPASEEEYIRELAHELIAYQDYRNGYLTQIEEIVRNGDAEAYNSLNLQLRTEYIRSTHHIRAETCIKNMKNLFANILGTSMGWASALSRDLAQICRSHCEDIEYIKSLQKDARYPNSQRANIQFLAFLLRLSDLLHFDYDRAPFMLMKEIAFRSAVSFRHWAVKNEGVEVHIQEIDEGESVQIALSAYCEDPSNYYMLQEYADAIEQEISEYNSYLQKWSREGIIDSFDSVYNLNLKDLVSRDGIGFNTEKIHPR